MPPLGVTPAQPTAPRRIVAARQPDRRTHAARMVRSKLSEVSCAVIVRLLNDGLVNKMSPSPQRWATDLPPPPAAVHCWMSSGRPYKLSFGVAGAPGLIFSRPRERICPRVTRKGYEDKSHVRFQPPAEDRHPVTHIPFARRSDALVRRPGGGGRPTTTAARQGRRRQRGQPAGQALRRLRHPLVR